jgi:RNA polymerase sigma-70 factor, ECF subfamily
VFPTLTSPLDELCLSLHDPRVGANDPKAKLRTLGDVLYRDRAQARVPEEVWLQLVRSIAARDQTALHALYERTNRIVFTLIVRIVNNRETAEELTLDVFHDVWRRASDYDPAKGSVVGWIMNQARSRAIDRWRFEHRKKRNDNISAADHSVSSEPDALRTCELHEQQAILQYALKGLTLHERQAIETAFFAELTYVEAAAKLNQPVGTVKARIRSGLEKLRKLLLEKRVQ